ncbi:MAG: 4Fe-4S ferredoxin-type, iron-sulfur binding domain protein [Candidatus Lokiarchaeum sp. GC14_75]|nr:MAG: 4Fe-4S ferredoxin-type, iron-sulfur binding domain protein [Candidatus Lokiarchaeum sp. GC14_75]
MISKKETKEEVIEKDLEFSPDQLILKWKFKDVSKKLTYDIKKCFGCSLCKLVCPVDAIELGPIPDIAQEIIDESNPKLLIDHEKCCYCMLCVIVCPNDAFHENIEPEGQIDLIEFPTIGKFYKIDLDKCIEDKKIEICKLCLDVRKRNNIEEYYRIAKECPVKCFQIDSPIQGEVIIKKNMLHKCDPQGCKACVNICPTRSFFIPEKAEDVKKFGKIACNEDECFYCGACENSCPDDLIRVERREIEIINPKQISNYPWIQGWIKNIKKILKERLISGKEPIEIPIIEEEVKKVKEKIEEDIPQLTEEDRKKLVELNEKVQSFLKSSKIRYWIKDQKTEKIRKELNKILNQNK